MKRKTAREILADSFRELAEVRPIDRITIREIVDNCGYSPATFYRNFKDKYDLIAWEYAQGTARIMDRINEGGCSWEQTLLDAALRYARERAYLTNLFLHTSGQDSFVRYMIEINESELRRLALSVSGERELDEMTEMYIRLYCLGTVYLTCDWILGKYEVSPEELAEVFKNSLPAVLRPFFLRDMEDDVEDNG